ncbi:MAG: hypothetical protein ISR98_01605 [Parcubacteria group bacterium]|nr:hypothetical protein [Parcubacteria group bacterium]
MSLETPKCKCPNCKKEYVGNGKYDFECDDCGTLIIIPDSQKIEDKGPEHDNWDDLA